MRKFIKYEGLRNVDNQSFIDVLGISREVFECMIKIMHSYDSRNFSKGGRRSKLSMEDQLLIAIYYIKSGVTYFELSDMYNTSESFIRKTVKWVETLAELDEVFDVLKAKQMS